MNDPNNQLWNLTHQQAAGLYNSCTSKHPQNAASSGGGGGGGGPLGAGGGGVGGGIGIGIGVVVLHCHTETVCSGLVGGTPT